MFLSFSIAVYLISVLYHIELLSTSQIIEEINTVDNHIGCYFSIIMIFLSCERNIFLV